MLEEDVESEVGEGFSAAGAGGGVGSDAGERCWWFFDVGELGDCEGFASLVEPFEPATVVA